MKILASISDRLLELVAPQVTAAAEECRTIGCCDRNYFQQVCNTEQGGRVRCVYAFGGCSLPGGGG